MSVVVVTGSGGNGSGRAIACRFARDGAAVVVSDIDDDGGLETVRRIQSSGGRAGFFHADVAVRDQVRELVAFAEKTFGGLGVLVNNASGPDFRPDTPLELWTETAATDLFGTMYATRFAIDAMRRGGGGAIVNMSSTSAVNHGHRRPTGSPAYDTAKAGIIRLTTTLGWLGETEKIRVNCLAPGWIATEHVRAYWESLTPEQHTARGTPKRLLGLDEVADAVVRLATDESLYGRVMVWWPDDPPRLVAWGDPGYATTE